jgi:CRP-like cAMP-binding protein
MALYPTAMRSDAAAQLVEPCWSGLLAELAVHERNAIHRASQVRLYAAGDVLMSANAPSRVAIFPITALVAVGRPLRDGRRIAAGLVGNEGVLGMDIILDTSDQLDEAVVQCPGTVYCMPADDLRHHFDATGRLQRSILRFAHAFLGQVAQNTACARFHDVRPRLAKWLLMIDERAGKLETGRSTSLLAAALGAEEREIEKAIEQLAAAGAVRHRNGTITIGREALEPWACECYETVRFDRADDGAQ